MMEFLRKYWWAVVLWIVPIIIIGVTCRNWELLAAVGTWLLAGGIGVAIRQIAITREATRKSVSAQVSVQLSQLLRNVDTLDILQEIYELEPAHVTRLSDSTDEVDLKFENKIANALDKLELLGALVVQGIVDEHIAVVVYGGPTALKCWYKLSEYINRLRKTRHSSWCRYLEDLAARTLKSGQRIYFYRVKGEPTIDLIKYFEEHPELRPRRYEHQNEKFYIELEPELDACVETQAKRQYEQTQRELLKGGKEGELTERLEILRLFLESTDFSKLRSESEKHLLDGKRVKFVLSLAKGKPKYEMRIV